MLRDLGRRGHLRHRLARISDAGYSSCRRCAGNWLLDEDDYH